MAFPAFLGHLFFLLVSLIAIAPVFFVIEPQIRIPIFAYPPVGSPTYLMLGNPVVNFGSYPTTIYIGLDICVMYVYMCRCILLHHV
ncbi:uncharacterized protein F4807DRAFT_435416 [Annulohypoxylon truncatum]|uniref:uncharacterized protein n=1 Tax=Annulohypoxylon truncatum TaxID=327061 RepID=UPI0020087DD6|nr:uncharacterized protein F4807DRAFT_435416 [Annulohypoxylon truncatum]KAI1207336.1 hypothetical protein F4807DRAFT_435416 [Annulohypoxylon truncatum]